MVSRRVLLSLFAGLMLTATVSAQNPKPSMLMGTVLDPSRAPMAGVAIEITSDITGDQPRDLTSDAEGKFQISDLPTGVYTLTARYPEYVTLKREGIAMAPGMVFSTILRLRPADPTRN